MNLFLDLDGTLISEPTNEIDMVDVARKIRARPHLKTFIETAFKTCQTVSMWTAASNDWLQYNYKKHLKPILEENKQTLDLMFSYQHCSTIRDPDPENWHPTPVRIKPLRKIWRAKSKYPTYTKENTLILDDTPITYARNYGNSIPIKTYQGDPNDTELLKVSALLRQLKKEFDQTKNIRHVEKRYYSQYTENSTQDKD